jgi:hypothetical protein
VACGGDAGTPDARGAWDLVTPEAGGFEESGPGAAPTGPEWDGVDIETPYRCGGANRAARTG